MITGGTPITQLRNDLIATKYESNNTPSQQNYDNLIDELNEEILINKKQQIDEKNKRYGYSDSDLDTDEESIQKMQTSNKEYKSNKEEKKKRSSEIPDFLKDPILILIIYIILSQDFSVDFFSKYIKYIKPNESGSISFVGVTIYGVIFAIIFMVCKLIINKLSH